MNRIVLILLLFTIPLITFPQGIPSTPTYVDNFYYGNRNPEWIPMEEIHDDGDPSEGYVTYSSDSKYLSYGSESGKEYLELKAYVEWDENMYKNFSAGIRIPGKVPGGTPTVVYDGSIWYMNPDNQFYYGRYEIEARLTKGDQPLDSVGLWFAFWTYHGGRLPGGRYWYDEMDIFEPGACQVKNGKNLIHYWTLENEFENNNGSNAWEDPEHEDVIDFEMFDTDDPDETEWHVFAVEWLPDKLTYYFDDIPFHTVKKRIPSHEKPCLQINLNLKPDNDGRNCESPRTEDNFFLGSFQINYFKYYALPLPECNGYITEASGDNYNFSSWDNSTSNIKKFCFFKNCSLSSSSDIVIRCGDVELMSNFTIPLGAEFEIQPTPCKSF